MAKLVATSPVFDIWVTFFLPPNQTGPWKRPLASRNPKFPGREIQLSEPWPVWLTRSQQALTSCGAISIFLAEADLAHFNLECLVASTKVLDLDVNDGQSCWLPRLHLEDRLRPRPLLVLALVGEHLVPSLPTVLDLQVVPGHQAHCMSLVIGPVEVGNSVLAVERYGLLSRAW